MAINVSDFPDNQLIKSHEVIFKGGLHNLTFKDAQIAFYDTQFV